MAGIFFEPRWHSKSSCTGDHHACLYRISTQRNEYVTSACVVRKGVWLVRPCLIWLYLILVTGKFTGLQGHVIKNGREAVVDGKCSVNQVLVVSLSVTVSALLPCPTNGNYSILISAMKGPNAAFNTNLLILVTILGGQRITSFFRAKAKRIIDTRQG